MSKQYNVLWFCTDQQRWDTIHALGNPYIHTPNLDRLAQEGVAFTRRYTHPPSRACFMTGRYPRSTKAIFNGNEKFSKDEKLVSKLFQEQGYTCGLTGKLHLTSAEGRVETRTDDGYTYFAYSHHPHNDWPNDGNQYQVWLREHGVKAGAAACCPFRPPGIWAGAYPPPSAGLCKTGADPAADGDRRG